VSRRLETATTRSVATRPGLISDLADRAGAAFRGSTEKVCSTACKTPCSSLESRLMVRVLFVCMGNICRSPLAQGVFESVLEREGLQDEVYVDSAGTGNWHVGSPPDERALSAASVRGLNIDSQRARQISPEDCQVFDYILTMDNENYRVVSALCRGSAVVKPFLDFAKGSPEREVPDPYSGGPDEFEHVLDLVEDASEGLLDDIRDRHLSHRS
jgi:protein-tyrosine phosphatase